MTVVKRVSTPPFPRTSREEGSSPSPPSTQAPEYCLVTNVQRADVNAPVCGAGATLNQETQQSAWAVETVHATLVTTSLPVLRCRLS